MSDDFSREIDVASRVARRVIRIHRLKGYDAQDAQSDAYLAAMLLCAQWSAKHGIPRHVYVGKYCEQRMTDLYRERRGRAPYRVAEVPLDEDWDAPGVEHEYSDITWILDLVPSGRERYVVDRLLQGAFHREIASELGISKTRVAQLVERVRKRCEGSRQWERPDKRP